MMFPVAIVAAAIMCPQAAEGRIYYDDHMVPHVFGSNSQGPSHVPNREAFFMLGFQQCRDYPIATLDMLWRFSGSYASIAGEEALLDDRVIRMYDVPAIALGQEADLAAAASTDAPPRGKLRLQLEAFVDGVNTARVWWLQNSRIDALLGVSSAADANLEVWVDPVPPYLSPDVQGSDSAGDTKIANAARNLFSRPVTLQHVLRLGVAVSSGVKLYRGKFPNPCFPIGICRPADEDITYNLIGSNGWLVSDGASASTAGTLMLGDHHTPTGKEQLFQRYPIQVRGASYKATGQTLPGFPCVVIWIF